LRSLLHVSDVHFGPKHVAELSRAVLDLAVAERPDVLVVSGDLTQRAKPAQFREARAWILASPVPVVYVPGNHDVPMYRVWERIAAPFGAWRRHFDSALVRGYRDAGLEIVGLNTAHNWTTKHGRIDRAELERLAAELGERAPGRLRVAVAHHPLAASPRLGSEPRARRSEVAMALLRRAGVELVLSGHLHHGFWVEAPDTTGAPGPLVVHAGTTTSTRGRGVEAGRNSLNWIEFDDSVLRCERRVWDPASRSYAASESAEFPRR